MCGTVGSPGRRSGEAYAAQDLVDEDGTDSGRGCDANQRHVSASLDKQFSLVDLNRCSIGLLIAKVRWKRYAVLPLTLTFSVSCTEPLIDFASVFIALVKSEMPSDRCDVGVSGDLDVGDASALDHRIDCVNFVWDRSMLVIWAASLGFFFREDLRRCCEPSWS